MARARVRGGDGEPDLIRAPAGGGDGESDLDRARAGDGDAFARLVEPLRRELHAHCYRMLGSAHDADDALQDALLRAWRGLARFEGRSSLRSWLYRVATHACLDFVEARGRRALPVDLGPSSDRAVVGDTPLTDVAWLGPYPDGSLADGPAGPGARYEQREAVEIAFVAALQHLPGNQRAALLLFDVLGFSAAEIAAMMDTSTTSVNSALARARRLVAERVPPATQQRTLRRIGDARVREIVTGYATALERGDAGALVALLAEDVTWSMPPLAHWYRGLAAVTDFAERVAMRCGSWRHIPVVANGQPALAFYLRGGDADDHLPWSINVLTLRDDRIAEVVSFLGSGHFTRLGLPATPP
ncbi:sigma-70 family RNA polymerase sigma factor [Streptosporangium sandarakinum]|uniref:sigma-70 family RNA polymerase sigma factor n=1 Tax=Streptosporangium sandarakinum TaxID=1260955 RepID=UPI0034141D7D